jgi:class 3 adenylate cyclase
VKRHALHLAAAAALLAHAVLQLLLGWASPPWSNVDLAASVLGFVAVPLLTWAIARDLDRAVRRLRRTGLLAGLVRAALGVVLIVFLPQLFDALSRASAPAVAALPQILSAVLPTAVASGLVLLGIGAADLLYTTTAGFRHLSTRLMVLIVVAALGTAAWLSWVGPEGQKMLLWAVERGHLEQFVAPLQALARRAGGNAGGVVLAIGLQLPFVLLLAWRFGRNATDDLADLRRAFGRVAKGNLDEPVPVAGKDEVAEMKRGFNQMLVRAREHRFLETAFGRYVSPVLLERVMADSEHALGHSELRTATVLFADIRGFTALSAELSPEQVIGLLNSYVNVLIETVAEYDGYINKFVGDAILVVWNAPLDQPDHVSRAVRCGAALQRAIAAANASGAFGGRTIGMGVGLNSGPLVVGQLGNERQAEFTVIGDTVNVASRTCGLALGGQVVMTAATRNLYLDERPEDAERFRSLGERELKGKGPVELAVFDG